MYVQHVLNVTYFVISLGQSPFFMVPLCYAGAIIMVPLCRTAGSGESIVFCFVGDRPSPYHHGRVRAPLRPRLPLGFLTPGHGGPMDSPEPVFSRERDDVVSRRQQQHQRAQRPPCPQRRRVERVDTAAVFSLLLSL